MNPEFDDRVFCDACGCCEMLLEDCWQCGGEGYSHHDCGEDSCCCMDDSPNVTCDVCDGEGGYMVCGCPNDKRQDTKTPAPTTLEGK
jgi:hypothetical protein